MCVTFDFLAISKWFSCSLLVYWAKFTTKKKQPFTILFYLFFFFFVLCHTEIFTLHGGRLQQWCLMSLVFRVLLKGFQATTRRNRMCADEHPQRTLKIILYPVYENREFQFLLERLLSYVRYRRKGRYIIRRACFNSVFVANFIINTIRAHVYPLVDLNDKHHFGRSAKYSRYRFCVCQYRFEVSHFVYYGLSNQCSCTQARRGEYEKKSDEYKLKLFNQLNVFIVQY